MITIIGAGPAGSYTAYLLAQHGHDVTIVEEHREVGTPVQCTGIMTGAIDNFVKLKNSVVARRLSKVKVYSKNNFVQTKVDEVVVWRNLFDAQLADMAVARGAKLLLNSQFVGRTNSSVKIKDKTTNTFRELQSDIIIGADGPSSPVARAAGIPHDLQYYIGMQAKVKLKTDADAFETYFGSDFPNFFGWVVPESDDMVRLGLGARENAKDYFYKFLEKRSGSKTVCCWESGLIPIYNPKQIIQKNNVYLIGDAATQVKATTGGGIIPSLKAAKILADCIIHKRNYQQAFAQTSGKELRLHLRLRKMLNNFTDKDYDKLLKLMNRQKIKKILEKYDRDTPIPLVTNLLLREPRFLLFGRKMLG